MSSCRFDPATGVPQRHVRIVFAGVGAALVTLSGAAPARAAEFAAVPGLGIEYKNEVRVNASAKLKHPSGKNDTERNKEASYYFLESTVTVNNTENKKKNLVVCVSGYSKKFDAIDGEPLQFRRTGIDMTFAAGQKTLNCSLAQDGQTTGNRSRIGQMGCRQIALAENQMGAVLTFVSGNNHTKIKIGAANALEVDQLGPVQDGLRSVEKITLGGGIAGAGGHPLNSPNEINGKREKMTTAIKTFATRFILSDDAMVKLADDPRTFNCNKCFGMGSSVGDPPATRTDFLLNLPSADDQTAARLRIKTVYDSLDTVLLTAGARTSTTIDLLNESRDPVFVNVAPTLVELPAQCTAQLSLPQPGPLRIDAYDSQPATLDFDCAAGLSPGASGNLVLAATQQGTGDVLGSYNVKARNAQTCDVNADGRVDADDIDLIMAYRNTPAAVPDDRLNVDGDGLISVLDARRCTLQCTSAQCAR